MLSPGCSPTVYWKNSWDLTVACRDFHQQFVTVIAEMMSNFISWRIQIWWKAITSLGDRRTLLSVTTIKAQRVTMWHPCRREAGFLYYMETVFSKMCYLQFQLPWLVRGVPLESSLLKCFRERFVLGLYYSKVHCRSVRISCSINISKPLSTWNLSSQRLVFSEA